MEDSINELIINEAVKKLKEGQIKNNADVENFIDNLIQPFYQKMLDAELFNMLDYEKYEHSTNKNNYRNGYCKSKKVQMKYGTIEIKTPRDRMVILNQLSFLKEKTDLASLKK